MKLPLRTAQRLSSATAVCRLDVLSAFHEPDGPAVGHGGPHAAFFKPNFLMRETNVLGLILSNSAAPPGP